MYEDEAVIVFVAVAPVVASVRWRFIETGSERLSDEVFRLADPLGMCDMHKTECVKVVLSQRKSERSSRSRASNF